MKKKYINKILVTLFLFLSIFFVTVDAAQDDINVNLTVDNCNNNSICESAWEDYLTCPADCTVVPVVPVDPTGSSSGSLILGNAFIGLDVEVDQNSAVIKWRSFNVTKSNVQWGIDSDHKDGILQNINYLTEHEVEINNLESGTVYYFSIESQNVLGMVYKLENQFFKTISLPDFTPPGNPTNLKAISKTNGIVVSWNNPPEEDFEYVRLMKNKDRYHSNPFEGNLIYEGSGIYSFDAEVKDNTKYYYSLFSRDKSGNYSSGSLVSIIYNPTTSVVDKNILPDVSEENIKKFSNSYKVVQDYVAYDFNTWDTLSLSGDRPISIKTKKSEFSKDDYWVEIRNFVAGDIIAQYFFHTEEDEKGEISVTVPYFEREELYTIIIYKYNQKEAEVTLIGEFDINKASIMQKDQYIWFILTFLILIFLGCLRFFWVIFKRKVKKSE